MPSQISPNRLSTPIGWALLIAVLCGMAALIHQLIWTRRMIDLLGASHESTARVFGTFFLGLAIGAAIAAISVHRIQRPWRCLAGAEVLVIFFSIPIFLLPWWSEGMWQFLGSEALLDWRGRAIKLITSILVVLPPATAMGLTLPIICYAVLSDKHRLGREGIWLYASNTLGGMLGLVLVSLLLLIWFGASGAMFFAIGLNVVVVVLAMGLDATTKTSNPNRIEEKTEHSLPSDLINTATTSFGFRSSAFTSLRLPLLVAFVSGFGVLAYEVAAVQVAMLVAPLSFYAPAIILAVIIGMLAVGAALTPLAIRFFHSPERFLVLILSMTGCLTTITPFWFLLVAKQVGGLEGSGSFLLWWINTLILILITIGPAILCSAFVFPATLAWIGRTGDPLGRRLGWLLALNGLGGWLGAEIGYRFLLPIWGLYPSFGLVGLIYLILAITLCSKIKDVDSFYRFAVGGLMTCLFLVLTWLPKLPTINPSLGFELVASRSGREGTVAVINQPNDQRAMLMSNQYVLGSTAARWEQERQAHLALLLHPQPSEVAVIGLATGMTAGAALQHSTVQNLTVIELSPLVLDLAQEHFQKYHGSLFSDPRTRIVQEDGRTYMAATTEKYDVIIGDLFLPWGPGEARLFSREHFQSVKQSLRSGGVYCQWLPMFQLTDQQFQIIASSFADAFEEVDLVVNGFDLNQPALGLIGFSDASLDLSEIRLRIERCQTDGVLDPIVRHEDGFQLAYLGKWNIDRSLPLNTLDNLLIELDAGRLRVTGRPFDLYQIGPRWIEWLRKANIHWNENQMGESNQPKLIQFLEYELRLRKQPLVIVPDHLLDSIQAIRRDPAADRSRWPAHSTWLTEESSYQ